MILLPKWQEKRLHKDMVEWLAKEIESNDYGTYIYNVILSLKHFVEAVRREKK